MKILFLPDNNPNKFAVEGQKWAFFKYWPEGTYHVDMIDAYQFPFISRKIEKKLLNMFIIQPFKAFVRRKKYDLIIVHGSVRNFVLIGFLKYLFGFHRPNLAVFDIGCFGRIKGGLRLRILKKVARAIDCVIYHATEQEKYYTTYLPQLRTRYHFIPLGIHPYKKTCQWDESSKSSFIIALGQHDNRYRDWKTLVNFWKKLVTKENEYRLIIVGRKRLYWDDIGDFESLPLAEAKDYMPVIELTPLVEKARFAILPLCERGHAHGQLTLLYLMSLGKAVIVSDTIGIKDYIRDGGTGIFYKTGNSDDLLEKVMYLLKNPEEIERIGRNAYDAIREQFNEKTFSEKVYEILSSY